MAVNKINDTASSRASLEQITKDLWAILGRIEQEVLFYQASGLQFSGTGFTGAADDPEATNMYSALTVLVQDTNLGANPWPNFNYRRIYQTNLAQGMRRGG